MNLRKFAEDVMASACRTGACRSSAGANVVLHALRLAAPSFSWRVYPCGDGLTVVKLSDGSEVASWAVRDRASAEEVLR